MTDDVISSAELSRVVGSIYDCAIDPTRWPDAIRHTCLATDCGAGAISVIDLQRGSQLLQQTWNFAPEWIERMAPYEAEMAEMWNSVPDLHTRAWGEPFTARRDCPAEVRESARFTREWVQPQGILDTIQLLVLRNSQRIGTFGLSRYESVGEVTDRDLAVVRLLGPHIQRAVTISDTLGMQAIAVGTFEASLDLFQTSVLLVDRDGIIIHANKSAQAMLAAGSTIRSERGELRTYFAETTAALKAAVAAAAGNEAAIGRSGIGVPAPQARGEPALIHVLPLMSGDVRARIAPRAAAALFVTPGADDTLSPAPALAVLFDLTPGEARTLEVLLAGNDIAEVAAALGIAATTVKTHLARIFAKTGTSGQPDLIRLAAKFSPPVHRPDAE